MDRIEMLSYIYEKVWVKTDIRPAPRYNNQHYIPLKVWNVLWYISKFKFINNEIANIICKVQSNEVIDNIQNSILILIYKIIKDKCVTLNKSRKPQYQNS